MFDGTAAAGALDVDSVVEKYGHGPLFPDVPPDSDGRRNDNGTNRINAFLHDVLRTPKTFYSHRHTSATMARGKMLEETSDAITGHGTGKISREYGYYQWISCGRVSRKSLAH